MKSRFTLEYWIDEGWYVGRLKEVPGVFSQGEDLLELERNIRDAYHLVLEDQKLPVIQGEIRTKQLEMGFETT